MHDTTPNIHDGPFADSLTPLANHQTFVERHYPWLRALFVSLTPWLVLALIHPIALLLGALIFALAYWGAKRMLHLRTSGLTPRETGAWGHGFLMVLFSTWVIFLHSLELLILVALVVALWLPAAFIDAFRFSEVKRRKLILCGCWAAVMVATVSLFYVKETTARAFAQDVVERVINHQAKHSIYPNNLDEVGLSRAQMAEHFSIANYSINQQGQHLFFYKVGLGFVTKAFIFETRTWQTID